MANKRWRVIDLANEAGVTADEALLLLWGSDFDVTLVTDSIHPKDISRARKSLGLPSRREINAVAYWSKLFGLNRDEFDSLLIKLGFEVRPGKLTLPKGAVRKLSAERRSRHLTGHVQTIQQSAENETSQPPAFYWYQVGHETPLQMLTCEDVLNIHNTLVADLRSEEDPVEPSGVRNMHLLHSAVYRPQTQLGADRKYRTVEMAAAALLHSLVLSHPFHNGNKRTGLVAMLVFLDKNGFLLNCPEEELFKLVLKVAQHSIVDSHPHNLADREVIAIAEWIHGWCRMIEKGEVPIPFRTLRRILAMFNCQITTIPGSRVDIKRVLPQSSGFLRRARDTELVVQIAYYGEGREVPRNTLRRIRAELHLDEENNVDSKSFYQGDLLSADDFIAAYRKTLRRLARL